MRYIEAFVKAKPDQIYTVSNMKIRNTPTVCSVSCDFTMIGTLLYDVIMKNQKINENNNKIRRLFTNTDRSNITNLTELSDKIESLKIVPLSDINEEIIFEKGSRIETPKVISGHGTTIVHFLNKNNKIHLIEYFLNVDNIEECSIPQSQHINHSNPPPNLKS